MRHRGCADGLCERLDLDLHLHDGLASVLADFLPLVRTLLPLRNTRRGFPAGLKRPFPKPLFDFLPRYDSVTPPVSGIW